MNAALDTEQTTIRAVEVSDDDRLDFLPSLAPVGFVHLENAVYDLAGAFCEAYKDASGYWEYHRLSNGSGFMAPSMSQERVTVSNAMNWSEEELSPEAMGICCTLIAMCHVWARFENDTLAAAHEGLREYIFQHDECAKILRIID